MFRLSNKKAIGQGLKCRVQLLVPGEEIEVCYNNNSSAQDVLNDVAKQIDLLDKDYYGLKLYDHIEWLDHTKSLYKQTKGTDNVVLVLRFKYYPAEPALLANQSTRYYLYLQLRVDLLEGRLKGDTQETLAYLIACVLQSELGDATSSLETDENYVSEFKFVPNQSEDLEWAALRLHQNEDFQGLKPADTELNFLKKACQLDTYGVDPYPVKEGRSLKHFLIGVNHRGVATFQDSRMTNLFEWAEIDRITVDGKLVVITCRKKNVKTRPFFAFRCPSQEHAHNFWKIATEHKYFFTLEATPQSPIIANTGGFFKKTHKLKYVGRVEKDLLRDHVDGVRSCGVRRSRSLMSKTNDGPLWQGFQPNLGSSTMDQSHHQTSMNNIYASESANRTIPASTNYFREEDENVPDTEILTEARRGSKQLDDQRVSKDSSRSSSNFTRKTVLTTKTDDLASGNAIRRGSQIYMDTDQRNDDFFRASLILFTILSAIFVTFLLMSDSDRPSSISLLIKRLNLDPISVSLRQNYYLPLKSAMGHTMEQMFSTLNEKIL